MDNSYNPYIEKISDCKYRIKKGFVNNMNVDGVIFVNNHLFQQTVDEINTSLKFRENQCKKKSTFMGFHPAVTQIANVAALPGIVGNSIGLPDLHSGYGFSIGNVAAFDVSNPKAVVSPGGVGFDINCGVRLMRTNLSLNDVNDLQKEIVQSLFNHIPVGVGGSGIIPCSLEDLNECLEQGIEWSIAKGYSWVEDKEFCEENGRMLQANSNYVSSRAKKRGLPQMGTLGGGNHYIEVQYVDEIYDDYSARVMGIEYPGQICVMIHSGSRGLGHQVATDALKEMDNVMKEQNIAVNDKQLGCARIQSKEGKHYIKAMASAANYAWVNRSSMTFQIRQAFYQVLKQMPDDLDMKLIYDVSHNMAKFEDHWVDGKPKTLLVHRKGSTRAFPPHHPLIPIDYSFIGQPVLIGGTMGTYSYVLTGTEKSMIETFGSTCHGAGRAHSRSATRRTMSTQEVLNNLHSKGIAIKMASPNLAMEEAPEAYKDVVDVVETCHTVGISNKIFRLKPFAVIKG